MLIPYNLKQFDVNKLFHSIEGLLLGFNNFMGARGCGELWFIIFLFWIKLLTQLLGRYKYGISIFLLLCIPMAVIYKNAITGSNAEYWGISQGNIFVSYPFFLLGFFITRYRQLYIVFIISKLKTLKTSILTTYCIGGIILLLILTRYNDTVYMVYGGYGKYFILFLLYGVAGICMMFLFSLLLEKTKFSKYTQFINVGSIMILATHMILVNSINPLLQKFLADNDLAYELSTVAFSIFILVLFIPVIKIVNNYFPIAIGKRSFK